MTLKEKTALLVTRDRLSDLMVEAGISFNEKSVVQISNNVTGFFCNCKNREDAILKLQEVNKIVHL